MVPRKIFRQTLVDMLGICSGNPRGSRNPWVIKSHEWGADLSLCNFATTHLLGERGSSISLQPRDRPFDSFHSEFLSPFATFRPMKCYGCILAEGIEVKILYFENSIVYFWSLLGEHCGGCSWGVCKRLRAHAQGKDQARRVDSSICQPATIRR